MSISDVINIAEKAKDIIENKKKKEAANPLLNKLINSGGNTFLKSFAKGIKSLSIMDDDKSGGIDVSGFEHFEEDIKTLVEQGYLIQDENSQGTDRYTLTRKCKKE